MEGSVLVEMIAVVQKRAFPVMWRAEGDDDVAVGEVTIRGERVVLAGRARDNVYAFCDFAASDVESVVVSRRVNPMLHVRLRDRGWLRVTAFSTVLVFELAQTLSQQLP